MALIEPLSYRVAKALITCFCAELAANFITDPTLTMPGRCCLRAGVDTILEVDERGIDRCCVGEGYVKIVDTYPSSAFPVPDEFVAGPCQGRRFTVALELGVIRCVPIDPSCEQADFAVRRIAADGEAAFRSICCWATALKDPLLVGPGVKWFNGGWTPAGPDGGCLTASMPVFVSIPGLPCC